VVVATIAFVGSSDKFLEWVADRYAPQYNFSYSSISGSLLGGISLRELSFRGNRVVESFDFEWSPSMLLQDRVAINNIEIVGVEVGSIKAIIEEFSSKDDKKEKSSSSSLPIPISIDRVYITIETFIESNIELQKIVLDSQNILLDSSLNIDKLWLDVDSNISKISIKARLIDKEIRVSKLSLQDIDAVAIRAIVDSSKETNETSPPSDDDTTKEPNPLMPSSLLVDSVDIDIDPARVSEVEIRELSLDIESLKVDIANVLEGRANAIEVESLKLIADTNLTTIELNTSLIDENLTVERLSILDIDTLAIESLLPKKGSSTREKESNTTTKPNPLLPKKLILKSFNSSIKKAIYKPVEVSSATIYIDELIFDITTLLAQEGRVRVDAKSNFATIDYDIDIVDNTIKSRGLITPLKALFREYNLTNNSIEPIKFSLEGDKERIDAKIVVDAKDILKAKKGGFNINSLHSTNTLSYIIEEKNLTIQNRANVATPYAKDIVLENLFRADSDKFYLKGSLIPNKIEILDDNQSVPLRDLSINYEGNSSAIEAYINSSDIEGHLLSPDFKKGNFSLHTKKPIALKPLITLPPKLQDTKVSIDIEAPLNLVEMSSTNATLKIVSNVANIDSIVDYNRSIKLLTKVEIPSNSLLRGFDKNLNIDMLTPLDIDLSMDSSNINSTILSKGLSSKIEYNLIEQNLSGDLVVAKERFEFGGNLKETIKVDHSIPSIKTLISKVQNLYSFEAPSVDGDINLSIVLKQMRSIELKLNSNQIKIQNEKKERQVIDNSALFISANESNITLHHYTTTLQKQKIFATKPSNIRFKDNIIDISPLWVNDQLKLSGRYDITNKKGNILTYADRFTISHEMIDLNSSIDIKTKLDGIKSKLDGKIVIDGGRVYIDMDKKTFATDSDIIIVKKSDKKEKKSEFMQNLTLSLVVDTKRPIIYKDSNANIKIKASVVVQQIDATPLSVYGTASIVDGSYYQFKDKRFVLKDSLIAFAGDTTKPILDIKAIYNSLNYEITIQVTGDPQTPNIIFSSVPQLSREQILSVILFDNESAGDSSSGEDMMKMIGGAIAKSALQGVGIKVDHLSLGSDGSVEVGKKIADKVTIIYTNDEVSGVRLQYDVNRNIKTNILTNSQSSGVDIIYRRDF
jgi:translocation and assembly module TamB